MKNLFVISAVAFGATFIPLNSFGNKNIENNINNGILGLYLDQGKNKSEKTQGGQKPEKSQDKQQPKQQQQQQQQKQPKQQEQQKKQPSKNQPEKQPQNKKQQERESSNKNQGNKSEKGNRRDNNKNVFKGNQKDNRNDNRSPSNFKNNKAQKQNFKHPYTYRSPGVWYSYGNNQGFYYGKNYGQWRSAQARNKHKEFHPRYEYEAMGAYIILADRNIFLINQTDSKIIFVRSRLLERRDAGLITIVEYDNNIRRIEVIERRRAAVQLNIVI